MARPSAWKIQVRYAGQVRRELLSGTSRGIQGKFSSTQARERKKQNGFAEILIFMNVPGGFAPATVAAPGAISLKKVSTPGREPGSEILDFRGIMYSINSNDRKGSRTHGSPGHILLGTPQRRGTAPGASNTIDQSSSPDSRRGSFLKKVHYKSL
jgi:hypothetical protein